MLCIYKALHLCEFYDEPSMKHVDENIFLKSKHLNYKKDDVIFIHLFFHYRKEFLIIKFSKYMLYEYSYYILLNISSICSRYNKLQNIVIHTLQNRTIHIKLLVITENKTCIISVFATHF